MKTSFISIFTGITLLGIQFSLAQIKKDLPDFGSVGLEELTQKAHPQDSSAEAAILFDVGEAKFDDNFSIRFKRRTRIKIYQKTGFEWANIRTLLYVKDRQKPEILEDIKAISFNFENGQAVNRLLEKKDIFREKVNEYYDAVLFSIPSVKQGSVIEFQYTFITPYNTNLPDWQFQYNIPVNWSEYTVQLIPFFSYQMIGKGFQKFFINESKVSRSERTIGRYSFKEPIYQLAMKDIPAFKDESFITSEQDYMAQMDFQLSKVEFPNQGVENYMNTWEGLVEKLVKEFSIGDHLGDKATKSLASSLVASIPESEPLQRARAIYNYVQNGFEFDGIKTLRVLVPPKKLLDVKKGNCTDLHVLLCNMLNQINIEAHLVILSTRSHGKINLNYPLLERFNYAVVLVNIGKDQYILDATNPHLIFGMLPPECINDVGLVLEYQKKQAAQFVVLDQALSYNKRTNVNTRYDPIKQKLVTNHKISLGGYAGLEARNQRLNEKDLQKKMADTEFNQLTIKNLEEKTKPVDITFHNESDFDREVDIIYLELPMIDEVFKTNPFKKSERLFPIDFTYKQNHLYIYNLEIPTGYQVDEAPTALEEKLADNLAALKVSSKNLSDNLYQFSFQWDVNKSVIHNQHYNQIKDLYGKFVAKLSETIVLKKKKS
jgi:hypothetical protein